MKKKICRSLRIFIAALLLCTAVFVLCACNFPCLHFHMAAETFAADCDSAGYTRYYCSDCEMEFHTDVVAPYAHRLIETVTPPTCTAEGYTTYACENCDYCYRADAVPPLAHAMQETVTPPSCTRNGYTTVACSVCDFSYITDPVPAPLHAYEESVVAVTCDAAGYTEHTCTVCGQVYRDAYTDPVGHAFEKEIVGPTTCITTGYTLYHCNVCEANYIGDYVFYSDVFEGAYGASEVPLAEGVDISKYNHPTDKDGSYLPLDFEAIAAAGYDFVILKIGSTPRIGSDGTPLGGIEPTFEADYAAAQAAGLDIGVYFYTYSTTSEGAAADAALVMEWLGERTLSYPIYFDLETVQVEALGRRTATELCLAFISTLQEQRYFGALYTNNRWLTTLLQTDKVTFLFDIWYARYPAGEGPYLWDEERYGEQLGMWQYSDAGKIPAISETISFDLNYAYKDYPAIIATLGYNGWKKP